MMMCSLALHPTVNKQNTTEKKNSQYFASPASLPPSLPLQNLTQAAPDGGITAVNTFL
jgi:hypothetical protein